MVCDGDAVPAATASFPRLWGWGRHAWPVGSPGEGPTGALEAAAPGQCGPEAAPTFSGPPTAGVRWRAASPLPWPSFRCPWRGAAGLREQSAHPGRPRRTPAPEEPRAAARAWEPPPTAPGSGKDPGSAKGRGLGSPVRSPAEHAGTGRCHGDGCAAPRPAPLGVAGGPTGRGLSDPTARRRPRRDQDGGRRGRGAEGRAGSSGARPHRSLSRSGSGAEMAPEAAIELPARLA